MPKDETAFELWLAPYRSEQTRTQWLYQQMRAAILQGRLPPGSRVPSTRRLAREYGLARGTVSAAYEQLIDEGYLISKVGAGTHVSAVLPEAFLQSGAAAQSSRRVRTTRNGPATISRRGRLLVDSRPPRPAQPGTTGQAFIAHQPALDLFPKKLWAGIMAKQFQSAHPTRLADGDAFGYTPLREAVAEYVGSARGIPCTREQIMVVSGLQQALDTTARILLDEGDPVWMEDPGYPGACAVLGSAGVEICAVPVDGEGLDPSFGERHHANARLAYVTPAHQAPLGKVLSLARRMQLLDWASRSGAWIFEDDYDSEYRYRGSPVPSLCALDENRRVIHFGSFSKTLFPGLRLGYLVLPPELIDAFAAARAATERYMSIVHQLALSEFIAKGHYARHLRRMRKVYARRRAVLADCVSEELGGTLTLASEPAGLDACAWIRADIDEPALVALAHSRGIILSGLQHYAIEHALAPGVLMGFAATSERQIVRAVKALSATLRQ